MPQSRKADFYLGCLDGQVYIDFDLNKESRVKLKRISFDNYGSCNPDSSKIYPMNINESKLFITMLESDKLDQDLLSSIILKTLNQNIDYLWKDVLIEYKFIKI